MFKIGGDYINKKIINSILIILILFFFISLLGAASAADETHLNTTIQSTSGDDISPTLSNAISDGDSFQASADNEVLSASHTVSGTSVQDIINLINSDEVTDGDTVYLGGQTFSADWQEWGGNLITVNKRLIISGGSSENPNGFSTINAQIRLFDLETSGITLTNINFLNARGGNGPASAIYVNAPDCTIKNCLFDNCQYQDGGAVHISSEGTNTKFNNCNFTNNVARNTRFGGAVYIEASDCQFNDCNFEKNTGQRGGGAIHVASGSNLIVDGCNFTENTADSWAIGGAISMVGDGQTCTVTNSKFRKNSGGTGGAIYDERPELTVINCEFEDNEATNGNTGGGAIAIYHDNANIINSNFTSNSATSGGAIYILRDCYDANMVDSTFKDNTANTGTAIYAGPDATGKVTNCDLGGITDLHISGGASTLTFTLDTDLTGIVVGNIEGAPSGGRSPLVNEPIRLEIYGPTGLVVNFTDATDENGQVKYDYSSLPRDSYTYKVYYLDGKSKEGTLYSEVSGNGFSDIQNAIDAATPGETIYLKNITYVNDFNRAIVIDKSITLVGEDGTVLDAEGDSRIFTINNNVNDVSLGGITFINGIDEKQGGAIYIGNGCNNFNIADSTFINNHANGLDDADDVGGGDGGGAIFVSRNSNGGSINNVTFINNTANIGGGAVKIGASSGWNVYNSTFINNTA